MLQLTCVCFVGLVAISGVSCSSNGTASPKPTTPQVHHGATTSTSPTTTVSGEVSAGHTQTATGPAGQRLRVTAGVPQKNGVAVGGPVGSWVMGFVVENMRPGLSPLHKSPW